MDESTEVKAEMEQTEEDAIKELSQIARNQKDKGENIKWYAIIIILAFVLLLISLWPTNGTDSTQPTLTPIAPRCIENCNGVTIEKIDKPPPQATVIYEQ